MGCICIGIGDEAIWETSEMGPPIGFPPMGPFPMGLPGPQPEPGLSKSHSPRPGTPRPPGPPLSHTPAPGPPGPMPRPPGPMPLQSRSANRCWTASFARATLSAVPAKRTVLKPCPLVSWLKTMMAPLSALICRSVSPPRPMIAPTCP